MKKYFTLIELITVMVVLSVISVSAMERYVDLKEAAKDSSAKAVYGAAQSAAKLNFVKFLAGKPGHSRVRNGATLLDTMAVKPVGWRNRGRNLFYPETGRWVYRIRVDVREDISGDDITHAQLTFRKR